MPRTESDPPISVNLIGWLFDCTLYDRTPLVDVKSIRGSLHST